jgi:hypothetical protein
MGQGCFILEKELGVLAQLSYRLLALTINHKNHALLDHKGRIA